MAIYSDLAKLGRTTLPTGTTYALIDVDGRSIIAANFSTSAAYVAGEHVIYGDNLYRAKTKVAAGAWSASSWDQVTVDSEIRRLEGIISGGIHYRGKTTTALYDGATTNPITIGGASYTAAEGDLVILDLASAADTYATAAAYAIHTYIKNNSLYYITNAAITAEENTSFSNIESKLNQITSEPEFLFDGTAWAALGSISDGLGELAYKNSASGSYVKPTGSGSVSVNTYTPTKQKLSTTTITGTDGTVNASVITDTDTGTFAIAAASATTVATADAESTRVGNADVGAAVAVGTSLTGTKTFNTDAIKSATLTGTTTFVKKALKSASLSGTTSFPAQAIVASVDGDELIFTSVTPSAITLTTADAGDDEKGTVGINTTAASTGTVGLGTTNITPATAVSASSKTVRGVSGTTTITGVSGTATALTGITYSGVTPAKVASSATTVATGSLETGTQIVTGLTAGTESKEVSVGTESSTVTVK